MENNQLELEKIAPTDDAPLVRPGYPRIPGYAENGYGYGYGYGDEEEGIQLREVWRTVLKHKLLIFVLAVIVTTVVGIEAYRIKSTYLASATIELGKENTTMVKSGSGDVVIQTDDTDLYFPQMSIKTKMIKIMSEPLLEDVVVNLNLHKNPKFLEMKGKRTYWEGVQSIIKRVSGQMPDDAPVSLDSMTSTTEPAPRAAGSKRTAEESAQLAPYVGVISSTLEVEQIKDTRALKISFTHTDPVIAAAVTNGVAQTFIDSSFEARTEKYTSASDWLERTTRELQSKVEAAEMALADYTRTHNIFTTDGKETLTTDKLSRLHDQATRAETERILKQSIYEEVKAGRGAQLPAAFQDQKILGLQAKLDEFEAQAERLRVKYGPENPAMQEMQQQIMITKQQIETSRRSLEDKLKGEYELALRDETSLKAALALAKGDAVKQNQDAIQYNILKQEVETNKEFYKDFMQKMNQAKMEVAQQHNNLRLIQPARPPGGPVGPQRLRMILFGFLLSCAAGIGLAFFLEYLDNSIKNVEDVNRYVKLPALGVIPAISKGVGTKMKAGSRQKQLPGGVKPIGQENERSQVMVMDARSTAAEAYRVLRTSMLLSAAEHPPKVILFTSAQPGEGKTTTVVNTAISLSQLGASVLIIDCDLRKPATHKVLDVDHQRGLSNYLAHDTKIEGLIQKLPIANLSLLPCGPIPPNPAELLSSNKMKNLLASLAESYDHILIDSPPLLSVADSVILSTLVDGVILVVHSGKSTRASARRARHELMTVGAKIFGVVLNNLDLRRDGYNYYYNYYYYGQGQDNAAHSD